MKTIIQDTADVIFKRIRDNAIVFTAEAQLASISQSISEEKLKGGIGNKTIALLRSDKEVELTVRNAIFDSDYLEMVNGTVFESATNTVFTKEENLVVTSDEVSGTQVTIKGTPVADGIIKVISADGAQVEGTDATGKVSFTSENIKNGDIVTCLYQTSVTGNALEIDSRKFAENYYCEFHTIEYNIESNQIVNDLYWIFDRTTPSGNFDLSFENGKPQTPEMKFTVLTPPGDTVIGKVLEIPRI